VRTYERSERLALAMDARCFEGTLPVLPGGALDLRNVLTVAAFCALLTGITVLL